MKFRLAIAALTLIFGQSVFAQFCIYNSDASVWDSSVVPVSDVIIPIGGSGQVNGAFTVCNDPGVQVAMRIDARTAGLITPNVDSADYVAPIGSSAADGTADWNVSGSIDFNYAYGTGIAPDQVGDVTLTLQVDCNPYIGAVDGPLFDSKGTFAGLVLADTVELLQLSQNLGFAGVCTLFGGFDPDADGSYEFTATVVDSNDNVLTSSSVTAIVGNPIEDPDAGSTAPIPTMGTWAIISMITLLGLFTAVRLRKVS